MKMLPLVIVCFCLVCSGSSPPSRRIVPSQLFSGPPMGNIRRHRYNFSPAAVATLEAEFTINPYPDHQRREDIANSLNVIESRVHTWFTNKRARTKKNVGAQGGAVVGAREDSQDKKVTRTPPKSDSASTSPVSHTLTPGLLSPIASKPNKDVHNLTAGYMSPYMLNGMLAYPNLSASLPVYPPPAHQPVISTPPGFHPGFFPQSSYLSPMPGYANWPAYFSASLFNPAAASSPFSYTAPRRLVTRRPSSHPIGFLPKDVVSVEEEDSKCKGSPVQQQDQPTDYSSLNPLITRSKPSQDHPTDYSSLNPSTGGGGGHTPPVYMMPPQSLVQSLDVVASSSDETQLSIDKTLRAPHAYNPVSSDNTYPVATSGIAASNAYTTPICTPVHMKHSHPGIAHASSGTPCTSPVAQVAGRTKHSDSGYMSRSPSASATSGSATSSPASNNDSNTSTNSSNDETIDVVD